MTWAYRPDVTWTLIRGSGANLDLTPWVLAWEVTYGAAYDPGSGRWTVQSAIGRLRLDNADRRFDLTSQGAVITSQMVSIPQPVQVAIGGVVAWRGLALIRAQLPLRAGSTVEWELRGRYWQQLRRLMTWLPRLSSGTLPGLSVHETARQLLRDTLGEAISSPSLDVTSSVSGWPTRIKLRDVAIDETGGQAWNRLAHAAASIPFEDRFGRLGMAALSQAAAGRITAYPAGLRPLDDGELTTEGTMALWGLDVAATDITAGVVETLVTTPQGGVTRKVTARYDLPADVKAVRWATPTPTAAAGWSIVDSESYPAPDGSRADIVSALLRKDVASAQPSGVNFRGAKLTADGTDLIYPVDVVPYSTARLGQQQRQQTPPWLDPSAGPPDLRDYAALLQFVNEQKVRFSLTYPLWAESQSQALPIQSPGRGGFFVPGVTTRFPVGDGVEVDGLIASVRFAGGRRQVPTATVDGWTYSGSSGKFGLPITPAVWPKPFDVPEPQTDVPNVTLDFSDGWQGLPLLIFVGGIPVGLSLLPWNQTQMSVVRMFFVPPAAVSQSGFSDFLRTVREGQIRRRWLSLLDWGMSLGDTSIGPTAFGPPAGSWPLRLTMVLPLHRWSTTASGWGVASDNGWDRTRDGDPEAMTAAGLDKLPALLQANRGRPIELTFRAIPAAGGPDPLTPYSNGVSNMRRSAGGWSFPASRTRAAGEMDIASRSLLLPFWPGLPDENATIYAAPSDLTASLTAVIGSVARTVDLGAMNGAGWSVEQSDGSGITNADVLGVRYTGPLLDWVEDIDPKPDRASFRLTVTRK